MTYLVNIQFTVHWLVLSDWNNLTVAHANVWDSKKVTWCDAFLFRPAQYSCPYHRRVVVWRDDLWCSQSLSAVTTDLPHGGWLPQCFSIHTVSSAHFPLLNVLDDYSPGGLCLNMSVRRSQHYDILRHSTFYFWLDCNKVITNSKGKSVTYQLSQRWGDAVPSLVSLM